MMQMEVAKAKIKQDILDDLEVRKEGMRLIGQEMMEEFEKRMELEKMRLDLASSVTLGDAMAQFKELDDQIQGIRDQLKADQQDLAAFEARSASQRNSSLFFKQLYQAPEQQEEEEGAASTAGVERAAGQQGHGSQQQSDRRKEESLVDPQVVARLSDNIKAPAAQEVRSPLRLYISTYLAVVLLGVMASDLLGGGAPKVGLDVLYALLAAGLGWNAWNERQAIITSQPPEDGGDKSRRQ